MRGGESSPPGDLSIPSDPRGHSGGLAHNIAGYTLNVQAFMYTFFFLQSKNINLR